MSWRDFVPFVESQGKVMLGEEVEQSLRGDHPKEATRAERTGSSSHRSHPTEREALEDVGPQPGALFLLPAILVVLISAQALLASCYPYALLSWLLWD
jgi:hypothetical protein